MHGNRAVMAVSSLIIVGFLLAACAPIIAQNPTATLASTTPAAKPGSAPATPTPKPASDQPRYGGVLTWADLAEPASFDLHQESAAQHVRYLMPSYNGLLQYDPLAWPEAKIIPDLAGSWEISSDGLEYIFRLRTGVKWHDGKPFTSEDVQASMDRILKPPRGTRSPRQGSFPFIDKVEATAPDAVRIRLRYPSASLSTNLATDWLAVLPKHVIEAKGDMKRDVVGTGPFRFKGYSPGTSYEYVKNEDYFFKGRPHLDGIRAYVIRDDATRFAALRTGRVLLSDTRMSASQAELAKSDRNLVVQTTWRPSLSRVSMNFMRTPWQEPRLRRAISLAFDRQTFIKTVLEGDGLLGAPMPSKGSWGIPEDELLKMPGYRQPKDADIAEARKLLAELGLPEGFKPQVVVRSEAKYQKYGTFVLAELGKLGIRGELAIKVTAAFDETLMRGAFDMMSHSEATAMDDPDLRFGDFYISAGGRNYGKYSNPKFDELYGKQSRILDVNERKKLVREMLDILMQDNPDVPIAWGIMHMGQNSRVRNNRIAASALVNNRHQELWLAD